MKNIEQKDFAYLGQSFQLSLLKTMIEDKKFGESIIEVANFKYFENGSFRTIFTHIQESYEKFKKIPAYVTIEQKLMAESLNKDTTLKMHIDTLNMIKEHKVDDPGSIKLQSLNFCKQQTLKEAIKKVDSIMKQGAFEQYKDIEKIMQDALQVGVTTHEIVDALENPERALDTDSRTPFPTGITGLDALLKGGLGRGELGVVLAPTGVGKSTLLTKFANSAYNAGANVLQIFFEDNENAILRKHFTIWSGISPDDQPGLKDDVIKSVDEAKENSVGSLKLMKLPSYGTTLADIKSRIRKYINEGNKLDLVIIDYVDCITSDKNNGEDEWKGEGAIMRGIESMSSEFDIAVWVATQGDRSSIATEVVMTNQMGGSIKKAQIGHVIISVGKTLEQKEHKLATMTLLKSRIGTDGVVFSNCRFDNEYILIDTESQNTLLGHKEEVVQKKVDRVKEVYLNSEQFRNNAITTSAEILISGNK